jgi:hypothetical protein
VIIVQFKVVVVSHFFELSWFARKIVSMHRQNCIKLPLNNNFLTCAGQQQFLLLWVREFSLAHKHKSHTVVIVNWLVVEFHFLSFHFSACIGPCVSLACWWSGSVRLKVRVVISLIFHRVGEGLLILSS